MSDGKVSDWQPIATAPKNCTSVQVRMADGTIQPDAHWASDLSGEEQPAFEGWFVPSGKYSNVEIETPVEWKKK